MDWVQQAGRLPGKALQVGTQVWFLAGLRGRNEVVISLERVAEEWGIPRETARRGLAALEEAGLVRVRRHPGRAAVVTILRAPDSTSTGGSNPPCGPPDDCLPV